MNTLVVYDSQLKEEEREERAACCGLIIAKK